MTEVICWSMKMRMVANRAGAKASGADHQGFWSKPYGHLKASYGKAVQLIMYEN